MEESTQKGTPAMTARFTVTDNNVIQDRRRPTGASILGQFQFILPEEAQYAADHANEQYANTWGVIVFRADGATHQVVGDIILDGDRITVVPADDSAYDAHVIEQRDVISIRFLDWARDGDVCEICGEPLAESPYGEYIDVAGDSAAVHDFCAVDAGMVLA